MNVEMTASAVNGVTIGGYTRPYLEVSLDMDEGQMKSAIDEFAANVSEKTLREWVDDLASDYLDEIRAESHKQGREEAEAEGEKQ